MKRVAIIGSGDLGQQIAYHAHTDKHYEIAGFFDDFAQLNANEGQFPILGRLANIFELFSQGRFEYIIIAVGYKHFNFRKRLYDSIKGIIPLGNVIHSSSYVAPSCILGEGIIIMPGCTLDSKVVIHDNVFINTAVTIAHDSIIMSHTFLSPRVAVAGFVVIGECCNIGINTTIIDHIIIADNVQTGGGAVIIRNIELPGVYVGVPAKLLKKHNE